MRPTELTLSGFRSYAEPVTFDFTDRTLLGIVGPIGSGKSSILDAIAFALYGKTPRIGSGTKSLINQRRDALQVSLTFEVDGTTWRTVRALRRSGASAHTLYRFEDGEAGEVADKEREVTAEVERILGLDFDAFRRSVLLAQNQFAQFLEATPTERNAVLKGVFGFDRLDAMREATKRRLDAVSVDLKVLHERRASAETDRTALPEKQRALDEATSRAETVRELRTRVGEVDERLRDTEAAAAAAAKDVAFLDELSASIPSPEDADRVLSALTESETAVAAAEESLAAATQTATEARTAHSAALEAAGGREALDAASDLVSRVEASRAAVERDRARIPPLEAAVATTAEAVAEAEAALTAAAAQAEVAASASATAALEEENARQALHDAHGRSRAHALRSDLAVGEPCPVCEQVVQSIPSLDTPPELSEAEAALARIVAGGAAAREGESAAKAAIARAEAAIEAARGRHDDAGSALTAATDSVARLEAEVALLVEETAKVLGDGDPQVRLSALREAVVAAEAAVGLAAEAEQAARAAVDTAKVDRDATRAGVQALRSGLDRLVARLDLDIEAGDDASSFAAALDGIRQAWLDRRKAAGESHDQLGQVLEAARLERTDLLESAGLAVGDDLVEVMTEADRSVTALATEVELIERRLAELDRLDEGEAALVEHASLLERLTIDLRPAAFLDYVLGERRQVLAGLAGDHLETLSGRRYRFSDDGEFDILDLSAAEGRRRPDSLSGGESFLASLALALALAEMVGRQGGRLDAFFLDEGFGSLDAEHIDLAMDGIERLVTGGTGRLVVLVSHVEGMRDRIEDLIVLSRHPITDHTVVESGAKP
ncbi:MAG TPA: SMC family ATPase [Acidimicrobiia bacterium]|nr:SMC family ATPase [Acidimicrobiia bacterium]